MSEIGAGYGMAIWVVVILVLLTVGGLIWRAAERKKDGLRPSSQNTFVVLGKDLWKRLRSPAGNFTYWTHLLMGVCFYGAIGVWTEILRRYLLHIEANDGNILLAMHTTYPAVIGATAMQLMLNKDEQLYLRSFAQLVSTLFFSVAAVSILAANNIDQGISFMIAIVGNFAAVLFWWIANAFDEGLKDVDPENATGGPIRPNPASGPADSGPVDTPMGALQL